MKCDLFMKAVPAENAYTATKNAVTEAQRVIAVDFRIVTIKTVRPTDQAESVGIYNVHMTVDIEGPRQ